MKFRIPAVLGGGVILASMALAQEISDSPMSTSPVVVAGRVEVSTETTTERTRPRPDWAIRAQRVFEEGVLAETAGNATAARRKYARALKIFADNADDSTMLALRPGIGSFLRIPEGEPLQTPEDPSGGAEFLPGTEGWDAVRSDSGPRPGNGTEPPFPGSSADAFAPRISTRSYAIQISPEDPLVQRYVALYTGPLRERTQAAFDRMGQYLDLVNRAIAEEKMPRELAYLPVVESEYQIFAVSRAGAEGMWQFMSGTARYAGLKVNYWVDERRDPEKSTRAALRTLKSLYDWFDDWQLALAAYNRGIYGIQRDLEFTRSTDFSLLAKRQGLPQETEHYVPKLMALVLIGDNAERYGFRPPRPGARPSPEAVVLERPLDLKVAAACAGVTESVIRDLNPSLRLWVTPNNEPKFTLWIPAGSKERFLAELAKVKEWNPSPGFIRYTVQKGDVLGRIAARFRTTAGAIQRENKLPNSNRLRPGQRLLIRPGRLGKTQ